MATYHALIVSAISQNFGGYQIFRIHGDKDNLEMTDKSGYNPAEIADLPVGVVHIKTTRQALFNNIISDNRWFVLGKYTLDNDGVVTANDFNAAVSQVEDDAFSAWVDSRFSNMRADRRNKLKNLYRVSGSRAAASRKLIRKLRSINDIDTDDPINPTPEEQIADIIS